MRQAATTKTSAADPLIEHLTTARDEALATARALLAEHGPVLSGFPREIQIENHLKAAEAAQRRLNLFGLEG